MSVLLCENISVVFPNDYSLQHFNYNFLDKKIYGLLGKIDSGIELLLDVLSGKLKPMNGNVWVDGKNLFENKALDKRICFLKNNMKFNSLSSISDVFKTMNKKYPKWDNYYAYTLIKHFGLNLNDKINNLKVNKKKLVLGICSIATRANITIFNDPVKDVDLKDRYEFYNFLYEHHQKYPRTIIISNDYLDEIDYMLDKILFLDKGRLIDFFNQEELKNNFRYLTGKTEVLKSLIKGIKIIGQEERNGILTVCIRKKLTKDDIRKFQKYLIEISDVPIQKIFIYLINLRENRAKNIVKFY